MTQDSLVHVFFGNCFLTISVILDASDDCHSANFMIGGDTGTTRQWDILVTQYSCDQDDVSGPPGCLQYYTSTQNIIQK